MLGAGHGQGQGGGAGEEATATASARGTGSEAETASSGGSSVGEREREREEEHGLVGLSIPTQAGRVADAAAMAAARHGARASGMGVGASSSSSSTSSSARASLDRPALAHVEAQLAEQATMQLPGDAVAPMPPAAAVASALASSTHRYPATLVQHRVNKAMGWLPQLPVVIDADPRAGVMTLHQSYGSAARAVAAAAEDEAQAAVRRATAHNRRAPPMHQHLVDSISQDASQRPDPALDPPSTLALKAKDLDRSATKSRKVEYFRPNAPYVLHLTSIASQSRSMAERSSRGLQQGHAASSSSHGAGAGAGRAPGGGQLPPSQAVSGGMVPPGGGGAAPGGAVGPVAGAAGQPPAMSAGMKRSASAAMGPGASNAGPAAKMARVVSGSGVPPGSNGAAVP